MDLPNFERHRELLLAIERELKKQPATGSVPQPARGSCNQNDMTRRGEGCAATNPSGAPRREGCEEREGHKQPMSACWSNAERMSELAHRVDKAYAELMRQARALKAAAQVSEAVAPLNEQPGSDESHIQGPLAEPSPSSGQAPTGSDTPRRLAPLQQAALAATGNCGSPPGSAAVPAVLRTGGPRYYYSHHAGPGGACPRAAA